MKENTTKSIMACQKAAHGGLRLSNNPFGEVWRTRRSSKVNSYRPAFPGRSIFAEGAARTLCSFRSLANIGVLRAGRAQPLYLLTPLGRFGPSAQVPTGHTLPSGAPSGRFALRATAHRADASLRCRAGGEFAPLGANIS